MVVWAKRSVPPIGQLASTLSTLRLGSLRLSCADREEDWDNFGQVDKPMVYGQTSDYLEVKLERKVMHFNLSFVA